jgi:hypothetical protein
VRSDHWRSLHFAWDLPEAKGSVLEGTNILSQYVKKSAQMCLVLTGFNTSWEQDVERVEILKD